MNFNGSFSDTHLASYLLILPAFSDLEKNRAFTRRQSFDTHLKFVQCVFFFAARTVTTKAIVYSVKKILVAKWLGQKLNGA